MKGLFYKEVRSLWHFGKTYLLMLVIFLGLALYQSTDSNGGAVWMLYPIFFAGTLPASLIGDDEKSGWQSCCDTLPVTRRQIVTVKYITCLVTAAAVCLLAVPAVLLRHLRKRKLAIAMCTSPPRWKACSASTKPSARQKRSVTTGASRPKMTMCSAERA